MPLVPKKIKKVLDLAKINNVIDGYFTMLPHHTSLGMENITYFTAWNKTGVSKNIWNERTLILLL